MIRLRFRGDSGQGQLFEMLYLERKGKQINQCENDQKKYL